MMSGKVFEHLAQYWKIPTELKMFIDHKMKTSYSHWDLCYQLYLSIVVEVSFTVLVDESTISVLFC